MKQKVRSGLAILERPREVEASLWRRLRFDGDARCREALFNRYLGFARTIARFEFRRRPPYGLERVDFEQLAYGGLLEAIDRFDPLRGLVFGGFARMRIRGAIIDGLAKSSESGAEYAYRRRAEADRIRSLAEGRTEQAGDAILALSDIAATLAIGFIAEDTSLCWAGAASSDGPQLDAYESLAWRQMQMNILQVIDRLPSNERSIVQQHYLHGVSFKHIASMLGVSKGRVSQLHRRALERVRAQLRSSD